MPVSNLPADLIRYVVYHCSTIRTLPIFYVLNKQFMQSMDSQNFWRQLASRHLTSLPRILRCKRDWRQELINARIQTKEENVIFSCKQGYERLFLISNQIINPVRLLADKAEILQQ